MSGGHFEYNQYKIDYIADEVEQLILSNHDQREDEYGVKRGRKYSEETIAKFKEALKALRVAAVYAQRIDWLVSGDDSEESFHERLSKELKKVENAE